LQADLICAKHHMRRLVSNNLASQFENQFDKTLILYRQH